MKITAIIFLSGYLICASSDAQYPWTNDSFHRSMCGKAACEELVIETVAGKIQGRAFESVLNKAEYYAFLGIPYAKPPVGYLRFQVTQPVHHWHGIYPAYHEKSICPQIYFITELTGMSAEDCLYLNVYTPQIPRKIVSLKPVIVNIHGGAFVAASGSKLFYSPDYLIIKDVVVVSFNYRLGVLGFLNLGIPECAGNMGLKDQVMALKWIQQNIARFGGDPKNIVISGESAGGASVHFHLVSPMSRGLFHKAIVRSGTSLSPWALTYNPIVQAFEIGELCGYRGKDRYKLLKHLMTKPFSDISAAALSWFFHYRKVYPARPLIIGPSVEMDPKGAFLPDFPSNLIKSAIPVPTIFGFNNKDGIFIIIVVFGYF
ncbi:esterase E4-like isoform X2 [Planococcus citri]|uniref:esterase E4-like isoform X2 n=1 Tax=Planococcus citri TaxID=170843 RepID=UPI0031F7D764